MSDANTSKLLTHEQYVLHAISQIDHVQEGPRYGNQYLEDQALINYLDYFLKYDLNINEDTKKIIQSELTSLGENVLKYQKWNTEAEENPPTLKIYDVFGKKIN